MSNKPTTPKSSALPARRAASSEKRYFIVNPAGAIHEVTREHARERLKVVGWRMATSAEVAELNARGGNQRADDPICTPWSPDPDVDAEAAAEA